MNILDENGQPINQLEKVNDSLNPLLVAYAKIAYVFDPLFRKIIDDTAVSLKSVMCMMHVANLEYDFYEQFVGDVE